MKITVVQSLFNTADFAFNLKQVFENLEKIQTVIIVFPQYDLTNCGGKDLIPDERAGQRGGVFF